MPKYNRGFLLKNLDFLHFYGFINPIFYVFIEFAKNFKQELQHQRIQCCNTRVYVIFTHFISGKLPQPPNRNKATP